MNADQIAAVLMVAGGVPLSVIWCVIADRRAERKANR